MLKQEKAKAMLCGHFVIQKQNQKTRNKIFQNIRRSELHPDPKFFKKLTNEIWEFRTLYSGIHYRLLAFWDKEDKKETLVFATHGIIKKTSKVEKKEIEKADKIRMDYLKSKKK